MNDLSSILTVTPQVVSSAAFHQRAAKAVYDVTKEKNSDNTHLPDLEEWSKTGGHLPACWGSSWACDIPYLLNKLVADGCTDAELCQIVRDLCGDRGTVSGDNAWREAYRIADAARGRA